MRTSAGSIKLWLLLASCVVTPVQAKLWTAKVASVTSGAGSLQDVEVTLDWPDGADSGTLRLRARTLDFPALGFKSRQIDWQCPVQRSREQGWRCAGPVRAAGSPARRLALDWQPEALQATLVVGKSQLAYRNAASRPGFHGVTLTQVPVQWLKAYLASLWPTGRWTAGTLAGSVQIAAPESGPMQVDADLALKKLSFETPDGLLAAADVDGKLDLMYRQAGAAKHVTASLTVRGGELLSDRLYVKFPASPVNISVRGEQMGKAPWRLPQIEWRDPGVLTAKGSVTLDAKSAVSALGVSVSLQDLAIARERYLSGLLAPAGFSDLVLSGRLEGDLAMAAGELTAFSARATGVNAIDPKARFTLAGIAGNLQWTRGADSRSSAIGWQSGALFGIGMGAARFELVSTGGELRLREAVPIPVLGGRVVLDQLRWQAPALQRGARFQFGTTMQSLDLASLSQRLGWPAFTGTVAGKIPSARYEASVLTLDGGLEMQLFGGNVTLRELSMERPFGVAPTLAADVAIQDLDLEAMTRVFDFGTITGRLDGRINHLRLVDWAPVAFDARLQTDTTWKGKQRISQRAVNNISNVGGSGVAGGLQAQALKFFDDFGYRQIGLGCVLRNNVCTMDGIGSAGDGYIIVAGAGLPRIQVVGFRRQVDWPTLVARLKAATEGQAPVIQ